MDKINSHHFDILGPLLGALGWKGQERDLQEALPRERDDFNIHQLRDTLVRLGYASSLTKPYEDVTLPALALDRDGQPHLIKDAAELSLIKQSVTEFLCFEPAPAPLISGTGALSVWQELKRIHPQLKNIVLISLLIGMVLSPMYIEPSARRQTKSVRSCATMRSPAVVAPRGAGRPPSARV